MLFQMLLCHTSVCLINYLYSQELGNLMELFPEGVTSLSICLRGNSLKIVTSKTIFNSCNVKGRGLLCEDKM